MPTCSARQLRNTRILQCNAIHLIGKIETSVTKAKPLIIKLFYGLRVIIREYVPVRVIVRHIIFVIAAVEPHLDQPLVRGRKAAASQDVKHSPVVDLF